MHFEIGKEPLRNPAIALHSTVRSLPFGVDVRVTLSLTRSLRSTSRVDDSTSESSNKCPGDSMKSSKFPSPGA
jgi:hypothetical protein